MWPSYSMPLKYNSEVRDINALDDLAALTYRDVIRKPIVQEGGDDVPALIADLHGEKKPQIEALFNV